MYLDYAYSSYKGKKYLSYYIAESYRKNNKVCKNKLFPLGKLSPIQVKQIKLILKITENPDEIICSLGSITPMKEIYYLDIMIVNAIWNEWGFDDAFKTTSKSDLNTLEIAKILITNRCLYPCSFYNIPKWTGKTILPELLNFDIAKLTDDKIYYELSKIEENKKSLEDYFFKKAYERKPDSFKIAKYDLSTSYFVGNKCALAAYGKGKDGKDCFKQVLLGLVINSEGLPFKWDVFPGNTSEKTTLQNNVDTLKNDHKIKNIILVFDRGIMSQENSDYIAGKKYKYISALNRNQIQKITNINLKKFNDLTIENIDKKIKETGLKKFDDDYYYQEIKGNNKRHILGFSISIFKFEREKREEQKNKLKKWLIEKNSKLVNNTKNTKVEIYTQVIEKLKHLKIRNLFESPIIEKKYYTKNKIKKSYFVISILEKEESKIILEKQKDGLTAYITNTAASKEPAKKIIQIYREKAEIETVFKHIKSFLKIHPFNVNLEEHVKATYTICIVSYFINKYLSNKLKDIGKKDYINSEKLYEEFRAGKLIEFKDTDSGVCNTKLLPIKKEAKTLLKTLFPKLDILNFFKKLK